MEGWIMGDIRTSELGGIPFGNTAGRPTPANTGQPYFNGEAQRLEIYTGSQYGWQNIVAETPGVTGYSGAVLESNSTNTITVVGTNFATGAQVSLVGTDGTEYIATTTTVNNLTNITAVFGALSASKEPYDIKVTNPSNLYGVYYDVLIVNDNPIWQTAAGSLGTLNPGQTISTQLSVTDEENTVTFSIGSGGLPSGITLSSTGLISGAAPAIPGTTTYSFTVNASDGVNTASARSFSITINAVSVSGGLTTTDSTSVYRVFTSSSSLITNVPLTVDVLAIGGGGGGAQAGAGAGGLIIANSKSITAGTYSFTVGNGGASGASGQDTSCFGHTANGGGRGGISNNETGGTGGSGGGGGRDNGFGGSANQSSGTGFTGYGFNGGNASQTGHGGAGGGGGAGAVGANGTGNGQQSAEGGGAGGAGHNGKSSVLSAISSIMPSSWQTATSTGYIGGGGGSSSNAGSGSGTSGAGGAGGGGRGFNPAVGGFYGDPGVDHTGGGGGSSRNGGSGVIIIKYAKSQVGL
jgi:hypothetical protein